MSYVFLAASSLLSAEPLRLTSTEATYCSGTAEKGQFAAEIRDDGSGRDAGAAIVLPRDCSNMRLRMETIGGSFHIISTPGQGTTVSLTTPFSP